MATERKKFIKSEIPMLSREIELYGNSLSNFDNKTIKLDLTSELRGKGAELRLILKSEDNVSMSS